MKNLTTIYFTWNDWVTSSESFKNNWEFYRYMKYKKNEWKSPVKMETKNSNWIWEWFDWLNNSRIDIKIVW